MTKETISFNEMPEALASILKTQAQILKALENHQPPQLAGKEILTVAEASEFLGVNRSTLWKWEKESKVKSYAIDGRKFFKRSELVQSLIPFNH